MLLDCARRFPDHEAFVDGDRRTTYAELGAQVLAAGRAYVAAGVAVVVCGAPRWSRSQRLRHSVIAMSGR